MDNYEVECGSESTCGEFVAAGVAAHVSLIFGKDPAATTA